MSFLHSFFISLMLLLLSHALFAQYYTVSGKVTDASNGAAIAGATVKPNGQTSGATTDLNGNYTVTNAHLRGILEFRCIGYQDKDERVTGPTIDVAMTPDPERGLSNITKSPFLSAFIPEWHKTKK